MEIEWADIDDATGGKRYVCAEKFARAWHFKIRFKQRTDWKRTNAVTRDMWETLLEKMERRYWRREGISDEDLALVRKIVAALPPATEEDE